MSIAQHAERILNAWNIADPDKFENELENALHRCTKSAGLSVLELERQELLESVVQQLRLGSKTSRQATVPASSLRLNAGFALLQHLSHNVSAAV